MGELVVRTRGHLLDGVSHRRRKRTCHGTSLQFGVGISLLCVGTCRGMSTIIPSLSAPKMQAARRGPTKSCLVEGQLRARLSPPRGANGLIYCFRHRGSVALHPSLNSAQPLSGLSTALRCAVRFRTCHGTSLRLFGRGVGGETVGGVLAQL